MTGGQLSWVTPKSISPLLVLNLFKDRMLRMEGWYQQGYPSIAMIGSFPACQLAFPNMKHETLISGVKRNPTQSSGALGTALSRAGSITSGAQESSGNIGPSPYKRLFASTNDEDSPETDASWGPT